MDAVERFTQAARERGLEPAVQRFPAGTRTAADAAAAVGCELGQIVKSLIFEADGVPVLILTSGVNRVDEERVASTFGAASLGKANADDVRKSTGFAIGGTPPLGHATELATIVDEDLLGYEQVWAAAGTPDTCFPIDPQQLVELSRGTVARVKPTADEDT